ncbi:MAG: ATP-binding protein, partial [Halomonas sp.]
SQSDAGALEVQLAPLDLAESLADRLDEAEGWITDSGITLETHIKGEAWVRGDVQRLRQLWNNLLDNTCAYTRSPGRLRIILIATSRGIKVTWEDSAPGVPEAEVDRLTERLYRVVIWCWTRRAGGRWPTARTWALLPWSSSCSR